MITDQNQNMLLNVIYFLIGSYIVVLYMLMMWMFKNSQSKSDKFRKRCIFIGLCIYGVCCLYKIFVYCKTVELLRFLLPDSNVLESQTYQLYLNRYSTYLNFYWTTMVFIDTLLISMEVVVVGWDTWPGGIKNNKWGYFCFPPHDIVMGSLDSKTIHGGETEEFVDFNRTKNQINLRFFTIPGFFFNIQPVINSILLCLLYNKEKDFCHHVNKFKRTTMYSLSTSSPSSL